MRPFRLLSRGEQERACLARALLPFDGDGTGGGWSDWGTTVFDEFGSLQDEKSRMLLSRKVTSFIRYAGPPSRMRLVLAGARIDDAILKELQPDWVFDPAAASFRSFGNGSLDILRLDELPTPQWPDDRSTWSAEKLFERVVWRGTIRKGTKAAWEHFSRYHYRSSAFPTNASKNVHILRGPDDELAGLHAFGKYCGKMRAPAPGELVSPTLWQKKRLVIIPALQGLGLGEMLRRPVTVR